MVVVIPAYDEPYLLLSLMCLKKCALPECAVEVIVIINDSERDSKEVKDRNQETANLARAWAEKNSKPELRFLVHYESDLPKKHAGVGLARKIGMDEACWRLEKVRNPEGIIVCFDADSRCQLNYLKAIYEHFNTNPRTNACSIHFEHPLDGATEPDEVYQAITLYELHLRYYIDAQRWTGFPLAYQTIGSSMAVRCSAYQAQGGMNKRQAGEDFYFLHKFIALDHFTELQTTTVIPSPRISHRVPFGTGRAIGEVIKQKQAGYRTYAPQSFSDLKELFLHIDMLWETPDKLPSFSRCLSSFLEQQDFETHLALIRQHTASLPTFRNRFFRWFNAFLLMKYLHHARDHFYPDVLVETAAQWLLGERGILDDSNAKTLLEAFRNLDRTGQSWAWEGLKE